MKEWAGMTTNHEKFTLRNDCVHLVLVCQGQKYSSTGELMCVGGGVVVKQKILSSSIDGLYWLWSFYIILEKFFCIKGTK